MREHSIRHMTVIETTRIERHLRFNSPVLVSLVATKIRDDVQMVWKTAEIARANQGAQQTQQQIQQAQQQTQQQPQQLVRESGMATSPQQMTANSPLQTSPTAGYFSGPNQIPASYALILQQRAAAARHLQTSQYVTPQDHQNTHSYTLSRGPSLEHITTTQAQLSLGSHAQAAMSPPFQSPGLNPRPNNTFQAFPVPAGTRATDMQINHPSQLPPPLRRQSQEQLRFTVNQRQQPMPTQRTPIQALQYSMRSTQNPRQRVILPGPIQENILQAHLTSPKMTPTLTSSVHRKLHITVVGFAVRGLKLTGLCQTAAWHLSPAAEASLSKVSVSRPGEHPTRAMVAPGSLIYRLRCVEVKPGQKQPLSDSDWVVKETLWPRSVFIEINNKRIELRRKIQWGKDLPADITNHLSAGQNVLRVVHLNDGSTAQPNRPEYYISIEIFQCQDQDILKNTMFDQRYISAGESLKRIMQRLSNSDGMEDDDLVVASSNVYIPLTCPLSFQLINIPVRGKACAHLECFDYDTFMDARPKKRPGEPPIPDSYLCPHCRGDVRPGEMVIDGWIAEHLRRVRTEHKGVDVRGVVVEMDGRWKYRIEDKVMDDDETESECEEELRKMNGRTKKPEPEIICIDDD